MNNHQYTAQDVEAFISDLMPPSETARFRQAMQENPALSNEVALQQDVVSAISQERALQLKNRLKNIDVNDIKETDHATYITYGMLAVIGALFVLGLFFQHSKRQNTPDKALTENFSTKRQARPKSLSEKKQPVKQTEAVENTDKNTDNNAKGQAPTNGDADKKQSRSETETRQNNQTTPPGLPDFSAGDAPKANTPDVDRPQSDEKPFAEPVAEKTANQNVKKIYNENDFHYAFKNGSLILYGKFDKTYELIETGKNNNALLLKYEGKTYRLDKTKSQKTPIQ